MQKQLILLYFEGYLYQKEPPGVKGNRISLIKPWIAGYWIKDAQILIYIT